MMDYTIEAVKVINEKANKLLLKYDDKSKSPAIDPSVNIEKIARACGVKKVEYVSPGILYGKHAIFRDGVVKIDKTDAPGQRRFDLAHEIGHIVFQYLTIDTYMLIKDFQIVSKDDGDVVIELFFEETVSKKAARQRESRMSELPPGEQKIEDFLDRFAANLLVPINRFQLWEDRGDQEIADAFHVEKKCIIKRREEIKHELSIFTSKMKPCSELEIVDPDVKLDIDSLLKRSAINNAN
jgi:Zn-dependent peptidase ImmA (M78 family)